MPPAPSNKFVRLSKDDGWNARKRSVSPANLARASSSSSRRLVATSSLTLSPESECEQPFVPQRSDDGLYYETEYRDEIIKWMLEMETQTQPSTDLIDQQPEIEWHMRPFLIDFIVEMHEQWRLRPEVLYLAVNIVDRYCSRRVVYRRHYQLIGCAALLIASKFEDSKDRVPPIRELFDVCCESYEPSSFVQMESHMLNTIHWVLGHPTTEAWLRYFVKSPSVTQSEDARVQNTARFIMELSLFHRQFVDARPSVVAWGALSLARFICGKRRRPAPEWFTATDLQLAADVTNQFDDMFHDRLDRVSEIIIRKYSIPHYQRASTIVREFYLSGRRFKVYPELPLTPFTPVPSTPGLTSSSWSSRRMAAVSPGSTVSCASSDAGDEPMTPISSQLGVVGVVAAVPAIDYVSAKENMPPAGEERLAKRSMPPPAVPSRPALHTIHSSSYMTASLGVPTNRSIRRLSN
ncbi:uncharacterized protein EHS24_008721 [Apiotrichum porosum]|uniref:Uncharacterized protein n=1 Tax=Apiotrichum porosum TaxID=105984 RepID=A0A427XQZ2_9TREE|nr:uncharacterized protein EHS24_008721 [Apiotrichum porosum]RSH81279.1 hypothetical protein EHS24_008721 [Apiotrichum porosum]